MFMVIYIFVIHFRWQPDRRFPFSQVKLPPSKDSTEQKVEFCETMEVEFYSRPGTEEAYGWWRARIKVSQI